MFLNDKNDHDNESTNLNHQKNRLPIQINDDNDDDEEEDEDMDRIETIDDSQSSLVEPDVRDRWLPKNRYPNRPNNNNNYYYYEDNYNDDDNHETGFGRKIVDCPKSLKLLIQIFRFIGYSFSGITFAEIESSSHTHVPDHDDQDEVQRRSSAESKIVKSKNPISNRLICFLSLTNNLLLIISCLWPFYLSIIVNRNNPNISNSNNNLTGASDESKSSGRTWCSESDDSIICNRFTSAAQNLAHEIGATLAEYRHEFADFKPILRGMLEWIVHVYSLDTMLNAAINLVFGGRLICAILRVPSIRKFDRDTRFARRSLLVCVAMIVALHSIGIAIFARRRNTDNTSFAEQIEQFRRITLAPLVVHFTLILSQSIIPLLFWYTIRLFAWHLRRIEQRWPMFADNHQDDHNTNFDPYHRITTGQRLRRLKRELALLCAHYRTVLRYFSLPLVVANVANIYLMISTACYLMVAHRRVAAADTFASFIFVSGICALLRLAALCCAGNVLSGAYREMIRRIFERTIHSASTAEDDATTWSIETWMTFVAIKRIRKRFGATIWRHAFSMRQSSILVCLSFALNYIVVLLQTENYDTNNTAANSSNNNNNNSIN